MWIIWSPIRRLLYFFSHKNALFAAKVTGFLIYLTLRKRRRFFKEEFSKMFPEKEESEIKEIIKNTFLLRSMTEIEEILLQKLTPENINQVISIENSEYLEKSLSDGKGVILVTFHFGTYLQVMPALGMRGYKVNQVAARWKPERNTDNDRKACGYWTDKLHRARLKYSGDHIPADLIAVDSNAQMRPLFRCLKNNEILIMALDGREVGNLVKVPFFHHENYWFASGPVSLALRTGATMHPIFIVRQNNKNRLIIEKEIHLETAANNDEAIIHNVGKLVKLLENYVRRYPSHYGMHMLFEKRRLDSLK